MLLFDVTCDFQSAIKDICKDSEELYRFLDNHERKPKVLNSICDQVLAYERKFRTRLTRSHKISIVRASAEMFAKLCIKQRDEQNMSEAQKLKVASKNDIYKEAQEMIKEPNSG